MHKSVADNAHNSQPIPPAPTRSTLVSASCENSSGPRIAFACAVRAFAVDISYFVAGGNIGKSLQRIKRERQWEGLTVDAMSREYVGSLIVWCDCVTKPPVTAEPRPRLPGGIRNPKASLRRPSNILEWRWIQITSNFFKKAKVNNLQVPVRDTCRTCSTVIILNKF